MIFNVTDSTGVISGLPAVKVYDFRGRLKGFVSPGGGTVTSVGLSMPSGFTVTNSPVTGAGVLTVTGNGTALDYIDGTGAIQTFPTINTYTVDNGLTENPANNFQLGGTLIQNTTITGANFNFTYTGLNRFLVDVDDFVNIVADNGTDTCIIDVSAGGATPYIELNVKNSTINHLITVDDTQILIRTPGVDTAAVSNGDVLTLIDATSGEVEFQTPASGTPVALPFTTDHLTATSNPYLIGDVVYYLGDVYRCIANNDSILPTNASYWVSLGPGFPLVQQPSDWNSTSGNNQILNKPTIPTYTVDNGLTENLTGNFQLGGTLIQDTTVDGAGSHQLNFQGLSSSTNEAKDLFSFETSSGGNTSLIEIDSVNVRARLKQLDDATGLSSELELTGKEFRAKTPNYTSATIGDVLTLLDNTTGAAEWQTISGLNPGFQDVLINDSTLTQNNTVAGANFNFIWDSFNRYTINTDEYILLNSTSGSKISSVSVNTLGAAPYVDLNTKNGSVITGLYVDSTQVLIRTPGVDAATVSNGYILTLTDAASGKVEFQTAPTGGDSLSPLLLMGG